MIIIDIIFEIICYTIIEYLLKGIGIGTKWLFYLGKKPIVTIREENWNSRIGFLVFMALIVSILFLTN